MSQSSSLQSVTALLLCGALAGSPSSVVAQSPPAAGDANAGQAGSSHKHDGYDQHIERGSQAYQAKNYDVALAELQAAYEAKSRPSILFNLGMISEKKGDLQGAVDYYDKFIQAEGIGLKARKRATARLAMVNQILATAKDSKAGQTSDLKPALEAMNADLETMQPGGANAKHSNEDTPAQQKATNEVAKPAAEPAEPTPASPPAVEPSTNIHRPAAQDNSDLRWEPYAAFGVGTAALAGGLVALSWTGESIDKAGDTSGEAKNQHEQDATTYLNTSGVLFSIGVVLMGVGTYLAVSDDDNDDQQVSAEGAESSASVSVGGDQVGVQYQLNF